MDHDAIHAEHERLLSGDAGAPSRLVTMVLEPLVAFVQKAVPAIIDPHEVEECCLDALLGYLRDPNIFDPKQARLFSWLASKARWNALTQVRNQKRRARRENIVLERVRDEQVVADKSVEELVFDVVRVREILEQHSAGLIEQNGDLDVFLLIAAGAHDTADYLDALGLDDTSANRLEANARRERIRGRIRRLRERLSDE